MTETEIIKLVFGLFLGVGGDVLLLLAFTVGYRYLVMEQRCTCRTNGTVTGYSAVCYGGENSAVHLPVVRYTAEGREYRVTGPRYRGYVSRTVRTPLAGNACRCYEKNGVLHIEPRKVIVVEGIMIFVEKALCDEMNIRIFVDADADVRLCRRIRRDVKKRGRSIDSVIDQYLTTVKPMHELYVEPSKKNANLIVPEGGKNLIALEMIINRIQRHIDGNAE